MKTMILAVVLVMLAGCQTNPYRAQYLAANPDLKPDMRQMIQEGTLETGMTEEQVRAAWGQPRDISETAIVGGGITKHWFYTEMRKLPDGRIITSTFLVFKNGVLIGWLNK